MSPRSARRGRAPSRTVVFFAAHSLVTTGDRSGAGNHIRGVIGAFGTLGFRVVPALNGDRQRRAAPDSARGPAPAGRGTVPQASPRSIAGRARAAFPGAWHVVRCATFAGRELGALPGLLRLLVRERPVLVYERQGEWQGGSTLLSTLCRVPHIVEVNELPGEQAAGEPRALRRLRDAGARRLYRHASLVVVVSTPLAEGLRRRFGDDIGPVVVVPNASPAPDTTGVPEAADPERRDVVFAGSMRDWHRLDLLVDAVEAIDARMPSRTRVALVGDGPEREHIARLVHERGLEERIEMPGGVGRDRLREIYRTAAIGILPAGPAHLSPTKLLEYAVHGMALLAPDEVGVRDLFTDATDALLVPPDAGRLAAALLHLLHDDADRIRLANAGADLARRWTWPEAVREILAGLPASAAIELPPPSGPDA